MPLRPNPGAGPAVPRVQREQLCLRRGDDMRRRQNRAGGGDSSSQVDTPGFAKSPYDTSRLILRSNTQRSRPVAGSTRSPPQRGAQVHRRIHHEGVAFEGGRLSVLKRGYVSPVRYVHAHGEAVDVGPGDLRGGAIAVPCASRPLALQSISWPCSAMDATRASSTVTNPRRTTSPARRMRYNDDMRRAHDHEHQA